MIITPIPNAAINILAIVDFEGVSFKMIQASAVVINGIDLDINNVAATGLLVVACNRQRHAAAKKQPARIPGFTTPTIFLGAWGPKR